MDLTLQSSCLSLLRVLCQQIHGKTGLVLFLNSFLLVQLLCLLNICSPHPHYGPPPPLLWQPHSALLGSLGSPSPLLWQPHSMLSLPSSWGDRLWWGLRCEHLARLPLHFCLSWESYKSLLRCTQDAASTSATQPWVLLQLRHLTPSSR